MNIASRRSALFFGLLVSAAGLSAALTASSAPPAASTTSAAVTASAAPTAKSSASAAPSASVSPADVERALPELKGADIPAEPSEAPKNKEWATARRVRAHRRVGGFCKLLVVREWLRIECDELLGGTLVGGDPTDVKVVAGGGPFVPPNPEDPASMSEPMARTNPPAKALFTMRLKKGETHVFSLLAAENDYSPRSFEAGYISVSWPAYQADPLILSSNGEL